MMALKANLANIDEIYEAWLNKAGATDEAMGKIAKSFGFLVDQIKEAGILILSYIGEAFATNMKDTAEHVLNIAKGFGIWIKQNKAIVIGTAKMVMVYGKLGLQLMVIAKVIGIVGTLITLATGGFVKLAITIAAVAGVMYLMNKAMSGIANSIADISASASRVASGGVIASGGKKASGRFGPGPYKMVGGEYVPLEEGEEVDPNTWPAVGKKQREALARRRSKESLEEKRKFNLDLATPKGVIDPENMYDTLDASKNRIKGFNATIVNLRKDLADVPNIAKRASEELKEFNDALKTQDPFKALEELGYKDVYRGWSTAATRRVEKLKGKLLKDFGYALDMEKARKVILQDVIKLKGKELEQQKFLVSAAKYAIKTEEAKLNLAKQSSQLARKQYGFFAGYYQIGRAHV